MNAQKMRGRKHMGTFFRDIKKYYKYAIYSGRAGLKAEVANSRLSWLWWILDPLLFMIIYWFLSQIVFWAKNKILYGLCIYRIKYVGFFSEEYRDQCKSCDE